MSHRAVGQIFPIWAVRQSDVGQAPFAEPPPSRPQFLGQWPAPPLLPRCIRQWRKGGDEKIDKGDLFEHRPCQWRTLPTGPSRCWESNGNRLPSNRNQDARISCHWIVGPIPADGRPRPFGPMFQAEWEHSKVWQSSQLPRWLFPGRRGGERRNRPAWLSKPAPQGKAAAHWLLD